MDKVIIIGAGIAGLNAGIYLRKSGIDTVIYEKNMVAGGFLTGWKRKNSLIDGCLHWMLGTKEGTELNKIWKENGGLDGVSIIHPESFCSVEYNNHVFHFYRDIKKLEEEMLSYSLNDEEEIHIFIDAIKEMGITETPSKVPFELADPKDFQVPMNIMRKMKHYLKLNIHELSLRFNSEIIRYALDNNMINRHFSAYYFIQTLANFALGNDSLPEGCSFKVRDNLVKKYESLGGKIEYNSPVEEILVSDQRAKGILLKDGRIIEGSYVISTIDLHYLEEKLLKNKYSFSSIGQMDLNKEKYPTYSFCCACFKTKYDFSKQDISYIKKIEPVMIDGISIKEISIRQYGYDKTLISEDGYKVVQCFLTTYEDDYEKIKNMSKAEYKTFKSKLGEFYLLKLEEMYHDTFELIDVYTPLTYERYMNSYKGTFMPYALGPKTPQMICPMTNDMLSNLILAGQWIMMPGGTPVACVTGKLASQLVLYKEGMNYII